MRATAARISAQRASARRVLQRRTQVGARARAHFFTPKRSFASICRLAARLPLAGRSLAARLPKWVESDLRPLRFLVAVAPAFPETEGHDAVFAAAGSAIQLGSAKPGHTIWLFRRFDGLVEDPVRRYFRGQHFYIGKGSLELARICRRLAHYATVGPSPSPVAAAGLRYWVPGMCGMPRMHCSADAPAALR